MKKKNNNIKELLELGKNEKWKYLRKYFEIAANFFNTKEEVITDEEIRDHIKSFKEKPLSKIRKEILLKDWLFYHDKQNKGLEKEFYSFKHSEDNWEKITLPHSYKYIPKNPVRFGKTHYFAYAQEEDQYADIWQAKYYTWYKKRLKIDHLKSNEIAFLNFDSSHLITDVWLNEMPVMIDHLGPFPFKIDVSDELKYRDNNEILVAVRNTNIVSNVPTLFHNGFQFAYSSSPYTYGREKMDWKDQVWSGIAGNTSIVIANKNHISEVFIYTEKISENTAELKIEINLNNADWNIFNGKINIEISKWFPKEEEILKAIKQNVTLSPMSNKKIILDYVIKNPSIWDVDNPNLYIAHVVLINENKEEIDDLYETFGVRTIEIKDSNYYLNNKKIIPRGTHDVTAYNEDSMICPSDYSIVKDILLHKKMGANCSRYPSDTKMHYKKIAQFADQLGYMMSWAGYCDIWIPHPEIETYLKRDIERMIKSLRNSPSIITWEMGDEPLQDIQDLRRFKYLELIYNLVEENDKSRPILPAGWFSNDLVEMILKGDKDLNYSERRKRVLKEFPIYNLPLAYWDFHYCPMVPPVRPNHEVIDEVKEALGGERLIVFTEFGIDSMPDWDKVMDVYGKFRWAANPYWMLNRKKNDLDYYEKILDKRDWKETQACQAIVYKDIIGYLRENPKEFGALYFMTMFDVWTFFWGVVDIKGNPKLAYYVAKNLYKEIYISGLHGNTTKKKHESIKITISNFGVSLKDLTLEVKIKDEDGNVERDEKFTGLEIKGNVLVNDVGVVSLNNFRAGMYSIEFFLYDGNRELARNVELFYIED